MSAVVDSRVVEMRFDNAQFERGVKTSMSTLDKLKQKLNLSGAAKGLENVNAAAQKVNFNPLSNAVQSVGQKFSALEIMGVTALVNLTNSAVNAGKRIANALTHWNLLRLVFTSMRLRSTRFRRFWQIHRAKEQLWNRLILRLMN